MNLYCVTDTRRLWGQVTETFSLGFKRFCPKRERARQPPGTKLVSPPRVLSTLGCVEVITQGCVEGIILIWERVGRGFYMEGEEALVGERTVRIITVFIYC